MAPGKQYRLQRATGATIEADGRYILVTIPVGMTVTILDPVSSKEVRVKWNSHTGLVFKVDLKERGKRLPSPAAPTE